MHAIGVVAIGGDDVSTGICIPDVYSMIIAAGGDVCVIGHYLPPRQGPCPPDRVPCDGIDISEVAIIGTEEGSYRYAGRCGSRCRSRMFGGSLDGMREMRHPRHTAPCGSRGYQACKAQQQGTPRDSVVV